MQNVELSGLTIACDSRATKTFLVQQRANKETGHLPWRLLPEPSQRAGDVRV